MDVAHVLEELRGAPRPTLVVLGDVQGDPGAVALLSGSFDPPTLGHLAVAEVVRAEADLVLFVYSVRTLPKEGGAPPPLLREERRLEALRALCASRPWLRPAICSHGLLADQATAAAERFPVARFLLAMGSDKALQLLDPRWYEDRDRTLDAMFARAEVRYAERAGDEGRVEGALGLPENARWRGRVRRLAVAQDLAAVSSRLARERLRAGASAAGLVPEEIAAIVDAALTD